MSVASELTALNGYILGAYDEINTKGGTIPANKNMANLASAIGSITTGSSTTITPLSVTENGTYTAPTGTAYSPVTVNVSGGGSIDISNFFGLTKAISGTFSVTDDSYSTYTLRHNLGVNPKLVIFACDDIERGSTRYIAGGFVLQTGTMLSSGIMSSGIHIGAGYVVGRSTDSATSNGAYANLSTAQIKTTNCYDLYGNSSGTSATSYAATTTSIKLTAKWSSYTCVFAPNKTYKYLVAA